MMKTFDRDSISWLNIEVNRKRLLSKIEVNRRSTYREGVQGNQANKSMPSTNAYRRILAQNQIIMIKH